jgi:hypothetical protein
MKARILAMTITMTLALAGCGSGASGGGGNGGGSSGGASSTRIEQINGGCTNNPTTLTGSKNRGDSCGTATDCKPTCCQCGSGKSNSWLGVECHNGACVDPCADTVGSADCSM